MNETATLTTTTILRELLDNGLTDMQLKFDETVCTNLLRYVALLDKWNKVYNLTAVRDPERMVGLHILDSLSVLPYVKHASTLIDVGSGGGLPGIPLAICLSQIAPQARVTLLDTVSKKTTFLRHVIGELRLQNVEVVTDRVENFHPAKQFDIVVSRAFAELKDFVDGASHLCTPSGTLLAMKGVHPFDEIARLGSEYRTASVQALLVPQIDSQRHLVFIKKTAAEK
jgi:16S rRNA (guanine527-N7)-methyltransferase